MKMDLLKILRVNKWPFLDSLKPPGPKFHACQLLCETWQQRQHRVKSSACEVARDARPWKLGSLWASESFWSIHVAGIYIQIHIHQHEDIQQQRLPCAIPPNTKKK